MKESKKTQTEKSSIPIRLITPQEWVEIDKEKEQEKALSKKHGAKFYGED